MKNNLFKQKELTFGSDHSKIGAFLFIQNFFPLVNSKAFTGQEKIINAFILFAFSYSIKKHHSPSLDYLNEYDATPYDIFPDLIKNKNGMFEFETKKYPLVFEVKATKK